MTPVPARRSFGITDIHWPPAGYASPLAISIALTKGTVRSRAQIAERPGERVTSDGLLARRDQRRVPAARAGNARTLPAGCPIAAEAALLSTDCSSGCA